MPIAHGAAMMARAAVAVDTVNAVTPAREYYLAAAPVVSDA